MRTIKSISSQADAQEKTKKKKGEKEAERENYSFHNGRERTLTAEQEEKSDPFRCLSGPPRGGFPTMADPAEKGELQRREDAYCLLR